MPRRRFSKNKKKFSRTFKRKRYMRRRSVVKSNRATFWKFKGIISLVASTGTVNARICLTNPANFDLVGTAVQDWANITTLFDSYRVNAIKLKYFPAIPYNTTSTTPAIAYQPLYIVHDTDSTTAIASENDMLQYEFPQLRTKNLYKPWKAYFKVNKYLTTRMDTLYVNNQVIQDKGYMDIAAANADGDNYQTGSIQFYSTLLNTGGGNVELGRVICTYYISLKNRR